MIWQRLRRLRNNGLYNLIVWPYQEYKLPPPFCGFAFSGSLEGEWQKLGEKMGWRKALRRGGTKFSSGAVSLFCLTCAWQVRASSRVSCNREVFLSHPPPWNWQSFPKTRSSQEEDLSYPSSKHPFSEGYVSEGSWWLISAQAEQPAAAAKFQGLDLSTPWCLTCGGGNWKVFGIFTPFFWGGNELSNLTCAYFSNGLVQPPTRKNNGSLLSFFGLYFRDLATLCLWDYYSPFWKCRKWMEMTHRVQWDRIEFLCGSLVTSVEI